MTTIRMARLPATVIPCLLLRMIGGCSQLEGTGRVNHERHKDDTGFVAKTLTMPDGSTRRYVVFIPRDYAPDKDWPTILFLHGAGERGSDNKGQVRVGIGRAIRQRESSFGFITIMPQCAAEPAWWTKQSEKDYVMAALAKTRKEYSVDPKRIYLTGLSMGGFGTWALAEDHPRLWAAIVPICGRGDPTTAKRFVHLPCWCFHGADDKAVPPKHSREMIDALKNAGGQPRYTEYKGVGHNSWDKAYATEELYTWLLEQRRQ